MEENDHESEYNFVPHENNKKCLHATTMLEYINHVPFEDQIELKFVSGNTDYLPWISLASFSSFLKTYLNFIDKSSVHEPCIILPDLDYTDFIIFKKYLTHSDIKEVFKKSDVQSLLNVFHQFGIKNEEVFESFIHSTKIPNKKSPKKKLPTIISRKSKNMKGKTTPPDPIRKNTIEVEKVDDDGNNDPGEELNDFNSTNIDLTENPLKCAYCSKVYSHTKARNKHMISEHLDQCKNDGLCYSCHVCCALFVSLSGREKHMKRMHPVFNNEENIVSIGGYPCPFYPCTTNKVLYSKIRDLHVHVKEEHPEKDKSCISCGHLCDSRQDLDKHIQEHKIGTPGSKPFYFCDHCDKVFLREYGLSIHKRNFHSTVPKSLECSYCGKDFKNAKFLKHHEDKHKSGFIEESQNVCPHCAKEFSKSVNLDRHIKITHQKVKNHECHDCGKKFVDSTRLKEHRWIHLDYKPFKCKYCEQSFRQKNHVKHHEAKTHELQKDHQCPECDKKFCFPYELKSHLKNGHHKLISSTNSKPTKSKNQDHDHEMLVQLQCELCEKLFSNLTNLKNHWKEHSMDDDDDDTISPSKDTAKDQGPILLEVEEQSYIIEYT